MKIIECPRDAMQGVMKFIPTDKKAEYINSLLKVGFDTIDFGSFVSPRAIPQLKDTAEVLKKLDLSETNSKLLVIIGNERGGAIASQYDEITYIGYPHSISESFLKFNINSTIEKSRITLDKLLNECTKCSKELVVYLSMAFGNPYGDEWNENLILKSIERMKGMGVKIISLSDTVGMATAKDVERLVSLVIPEFSDLEIGLHLHTTANTWKEKVSLAWKNGCKRFDAVIEGYGGCPMTKHELVGNLNTTNLLLYLTENNIEHNLNIELFNKAREVTNIFAFNYFGI